MGECNPHVERLTPAQIYGYARQAGFVPWQAVFATAIALAESGGDRYAYNCHPPDDSYGLWQINMIGSLGPARRQQFGLAGNEELYDPLVNARAAFAISNKGTNWHPWTTFTSGAYKKYWTTSIAAGQAHGLTATDIPQAGLAQEIYDALSQGKITQKDADKALKTLPESSAGVAEGEDLTLGQVAGGIGIPGAGSILSWTEALGKVLSALLDPKFWLRIGQGLASVMLLLIGAGLVFRREELTTAVKGVMA